MIPLTGADAQVLDLLAHVIAIGKHRGTKRRPLFTAADVARVAATWLRGPAHIPPDAAARILTERRRADTAERRCRAMAARIAKLEAGRAA